MPTNKNYELLITGKQAFPKILKCIQNAKESIYINMFIWRDDSIGNLIAQECLNAANRGVIINISKDVYGSVCEHAEESGTSFFHKKTSTSEKIKVWALKAIYKNPIIKNTKDSDSPLYKEFMSHPNIKVQAQTFKADHSKFYIFDNQILILGGINIEDKENGADMAGRVYNDYMIFLNGKEYVQLFEMYRNKKAAQTPEPDSINDIYFGINRKLPEGSKKKPEDTFELEQQYLDLINSTRQQLTIVMAYFSPMKNFINAIVKASERGAKVRIVFPGSANFQDCSNKATAKKLLKKSNGKIEIFFSPKMLHTKLVANEQLISFGSCNITKKAFNQLDELNAFVRNSNADLYSEILQSVEKTFSEANRADLKSIKYNGFLAFLESFII